MLFINEHDFWCSDFIVDGMYCVLYVHNDKQRYVYNHCKGVFIIILVHIKEI